MLEELSPLAAGIAIPTLWILAAYRAWIRPALTRKDQNR